MLRYVRTANPRLLDVVQQMIRKPIKIVKGTLGGLPFRCCPCVEAAEGICVALAELSKHNVHVMQQVGAGDHVVAAFNATHIQPKAPFGDDVNCFAHKHVVHVYVCACTSACQLIAQAQCHFLHNDKRSPAVTV